MKLMDIYKHFEKKYKNLRNFLMFAFLALVIIAAAFGYSWYSRRYNGDAQSALSESIELYRRAVREKSSVILNEAERAFAIGHGKYSSSSVTPFFLSFQAEILSKQGKVGQAIAVMQNSLKKMSKRIPLYGMYAVKLALMKIDSPDPLVVKEGQKSLEIFANDKKNSGRATALYHQGLIAFASADRVLAEKSWNTLIDDFEKSAWTKMAQRKLDYNG